MKWAANLLNGDATAFAYPGREYYAQFYMFYFYYAFDLIY